jgi:hypothetical protein
MERRAMSKFSVPNDPPSSPPLPFLLFSLPKFFSFFASTSSRCGKSRRLRGTAPWSAYLDAHGTIGELEPRRTCNGVSSQLEQGDMDVI